MRNSGHSGALHEMPEKGGSRFPSSGTNARAGSSLSRIDVTTAGEGFNGGNRIASSPTAAERGSPATAMRIWSAAGASSTATAHHRSLHRPSVAPLHGSTRKPHSPRDYVRVTPAEDDDLDALYRIIATLFALIAIAGVVTYL